jgi:simple sugar transport system permease protein
MSESGGQRAEFAEDDDFDMSRASGRAGMILRRIVFLLEFPSIVAAVVVALSLSVFSPHFFWTSQIWEVILSYGGRVGLVGAGVCILMTAGELDLSVYSVATFTPIVAFSLWGSGLNIWVAAVVALLFAGAVGLLNSQITLRGGITSFITTLGTGYIFLSVDLWLTGSSTLPGPTDRTWIYVMGSGKWLSAWNLPYTTDILWFVGIIILFQVLLTKTKHGNWTLAAGGNRSAAQAIGVNTVRTKTINFVLCSIMAGFSGMLTLTSMQSANANTELGLQLLAIVAVCAGGTAFYGGIGTEVGTAIGAVLIGIIYVGIDLAGTTSWYEAIFGVALIAVIIINERVRRAKGRIRTR